MAMRRYARNNKHCRSRLLSANQSGRKQVQLMAIKLIADYVIGESKCVEKRKVDNRRLILNIKLIGDYVIGD